ncbi:uncharacterized protein LOC128999315 [Macrosteles quadrilineatus]|uniref:uncharacterized protein LOC128999315 n=1 Tax=Macrosteles quadrilineatus TaxID=74068 RepID=UPI0023E0E37D|nr:uncharacterized protein LOC128999315 [Macrosteles quadrilineatus]
MAALVQACQTPQKKEKKCWPTGHKYGGPCLCKCKLRYIQPERPQSFKPITSFKQPDCKINDGTTYKMSYYGFDPKVVKNCRGQPVIAKENLVSSGDFSSDTTHKMSYGAWPGFKPPTTIVPADHKLIGDGPLSHLTTHKHDYTPKPLQEVERVIHEGNLGFSQDPMEDKTTNNMSYQVPDYNRFEPATSFKPNSIFNPPSSKMDDKTTHKMSFQPFCPPEKEEYPWAQKPRYQAPKVRFDGSTIYNGSYFAPGQFIEDCMGPDGCYCMYPGECFDKAEEPPKAHDFDICPSGYNPQVCQPRPMPVICEESANGFGNKRFNGNYDLSKEC